MSFKIKPFIFLIVASALVTGTGCNKFLEENDPSNLTPDVFYTIPEHATAAIASAYARTRDVVGGGAGIFVNNFQMLEAATGTAKTETGQNADLNNILGMGFKGDNVMVNNWWNGLYNVVAQTNLILEKVPGINPMEEALKKRILGEAYFLRAWAYFYLVRLYGDVPLIVTTQSSTSPDFFPTRAPQEDVYALIVSDLTTAAAAGLPMAETSGRAGMGAVKSLLSKVYLTMAGASLNKGTTHYKLAADKAAEVINSNAFALKHLLFPLPTAEMPNNPGY